MELEIQKNMQNIEVKISSFTLFHIPYVWAIKTNDCVYTQSGNIHCGA